MKDESDLCRRTIRLFEQSSVTSGAVMNGLKTLESRWATGEGNNFIMNQANSREFSKQMIND